MNYSKDVDCNFIKTVLMIAVVLCHSACFWGGKWFTSNPESEVLILKYLSNWLGTWHVQSFTMVSGYIFYLGKYECNKYDSYSNFILLKAKRLLVPYFFVSLFYVIPIQIYFFGFDECHILRKYILSESPSQLWFVIMLFVVFCLFWPLADFFKEKVELGLFVVLILFSIGTIGNVLLPNVFQLFTSLKYILYFYIGFKLRQYGLFNLRIINPSFLVLGHLVFFIITRNLELTSNRIILFAMNNILSITGVFMAFMCLSELAKNNSYKKSTLFIMLEANSWGIYLFHQQIIYFVIYYLNCRINPYMNFILNFIVSLILSTGISFLLSKAKLTRFLIGVK